uniref:Prominin 1a n=1 Tax=Oryzias sinensis TaxID=183150 RepID=A0A8C7ZFJ3_9TELE
MLEIGTLLLLLSVFSASGELQQETEQRRLPPPGKLDFGYVPAGVYETLAHYEPGPIGILFHLVQSFLRAVQPNAFPHDLIIKLAKDKFGAIQAEYQKAIYYEIGFLVCAAVGLLFAVLMPVVGLFFCMCRCCDNCGGEMHQRQRKNADCRRGLLGTLLFSTSIGVLCSYAANQNLSSQVKNIRRLVNSNMRDLHTFANDTPMVRLPHRRITALFQLQIYSKKLLNLQCLLGWRTKVQLFCLISTSVIPAMRETKEALENVSVSLVVLQEGTGKLSSDLSQVRSSINRTLSDPDCYDEESDATTVQLCHSIRQSLPQLQIGANFTRVKTDCNILFFLSMYYFKLKLFLFSQGFSSLNDTPDMVMEQTRSVVDSVQSLMDGIGNNISTFSKVFPVQSFLSNYTIFISHAHAKIEDYYPEIDKIDFYRWIGCIALCCMVVLVLAFNYLGLLCGTLGYDKHASPTTRGCISNTGGTMLMAGVGFSFIFSWVLMAVVTVLFLAGGNMEKLVCEPFHNKELFKDLLDTHFHSVHKVAAKTFTKPRLTLSLSSCLSWFFSTCKQNRGIYSAMRLDKIFNMSSFLNTTVFTKDVVDKLEGVKIDLRGIILLEADGKQNLRDFSEVGLSEINYADYLEEVNKGVTEVDLLSFTRELESQTDLMPRGPLQTALKNHVGTLQQIHKQQVIPMEQTLVKAASTLNQSMRFLERTASDLSNKVIAVLDAVEAAQYLISQNVTLLINQETRKYTSTIIGYFHQYIEWVKTSLAMEVAPCKPFSNILDTAEILSCSFLVDSMNVFWMGLGCSTLFLLPSVILAVKLAKYYRRMDTEDVYDDIPTYDTMNRFPRASAPPRHIDW